jgi:hypothetical protein
VEADMHAQVHRASSWTHAAFVFALLIGIAAPRAAQARPLFAAGYEAYPSDGGCHSVAIGDVDGDGLPDVVTANPDSHTVSIRLGTGEGSLGDRVDLPTGTRPRAVVIAELNGDAQPDLVITDNGAAVVLIRLGIGGGTFGPATSFAVGAVPFTSAVGDLDGDGKLDIVTGPHSLLGNGDGTFQPFVATGHTGGIPLLARLNGDAILDLAVSRGASGVSISFGVGDGTFLPRVDYAGSSGGIAAGDLDGDTDADLVTTTPGTFGGPGTSVKVFLNDGGGGLAAPVAHPCPESPGDVTLEDLNDDGRLDAVVGAAGGVGTLLGNGDGTLFSGYVRRVGPCVSGLDVGDLDLDGRLDAVTGSTCGGLYVTLGNGDGRFGRAPESPTSSLTSAFPYPSDLELADLDHDGQLDAVVTNDNAASLTTMLRTGITTLGDTTEVPTPGRPFGLALGDVDGDGRLDAALACAFPRSVSVLMGTPGGGFGARTDYPLSPSGVPYDVAIGDLDRDDHPDLAVVGGTPNGVAVLFNHGDGTFGSEVDVPFGTSVRSILYGAVASTMDLVVSNTGANAISLLISYGDRTFLPRIDLPVSSAPVDAAIGDFDEDGQTDIASVGGFPGDLDLLLRNPDGTFAPRVRIAPGTYPEAVAAGDVNIDGHLDLAVVGNDGTVAVHLGRGDGTFAEWRGYGGVGRTEDVAIGDVSGDGLPELVVTNTNRGTISVLLNQLVAPGPLAAAPAIPGGSGIRILSAAPNPARAGVTLTLELSRVAPLRADVFDAGGRRVRTLVDAARVEAGPRRLAWDGRDAHGAAVAPGLYWIGVRSRDARAVRRIAIVR